MGSGKSYQESSDLIRLETDNVSEAKYQIRKTESDQQFTLALELVPLVRLYRKRYDHLDEETLDYYRQVSSSGFSFGEYAAGQCASITLAEPRHWNRSLWVRELHVAGAHQRRGVGRQLVDALTEKARAVVPRTIVSGTQNTNIPAIRVYRRVGFHFEGTDLSYYSNDDYPDGEIALFMKKRLLPQDVSLNNAE